MSTIAGERTADPLLRFASDIVCAYVGRNKIAADNLPHLLRSVHETLGGLGQSGGSAMTASLKPAVPVKRSVTDDHIICLEDGKKLKTMKRYLWARYRLSPEDYRIKWGLPVDYPMVAPNYAATRSELAKKIGLGKDRGKKRRR